MSFLTPSALTLSVRTQSTRPLSVRALSGHNLSTGTLSLRPMHPFCVGSPSVLMSWLMWGRRLYAFFTPCTILPRVYGLDFWSGCNIIFARVGNLHLLIYYTCAFLKSNNLTFCTCSCLVNLSPVLHLWFLFFLFLESLSTMICLNFTRYLLRIMCKTNFLYIMHISYRSDALSCRFVVNLHEA